MSDHVVQVLQEFYVTMITSWTCFLYSSVYALTSSVWEMAAPIKHFKPNVEVSTRNQSSKNDAKDIGHEHFMSTIRLQWHTVVTRNSLINSQSSELLVQ